MSMPTAAFHVRRVLNERLDVALDRVLEELTTEG